MTGPRTYSAGTRAALAHLSRGRCYNPDCERQEPIIRFVAGEPHVDYHIAHIRDARPGNRYVAAMTDDDRRAFANLVLLCKPCHDIVDKDRPHDYPIERLERWKREREGPHDGPLAAVRSVDETELAELFRAAFRAAIGNPEIAVRKTAGVLSIVDGGVPRLLPLEPATVLPSAAASPTSLVKARSGIVPFTVHEDLRSTLLDWCLDGAAFSARLLGGKGGTGKTRLGVQLCEDLAPAGWVAGMLTQLLHQPEMEALVAAPTARLVVIDYAEARADQVAAWLPRLAALATPQHPVRALLLVRAGRGQDWAGALRGHGDAFSAMLDAVALDVLDARPPAEAGRRRLFSAAARAFATRAGAGEVAIPEPENLDDAAFATPLLVVVKAYLDVHGGGNAQTRSGLLEELLHHEDRYWRSTGSGSPEDPVLRRRVVALATLAGAGSETEAAERLRLVPDLVDASEERRRALARWAHDQYEGGLEWWNPVEPDLVAEHLIASTFYDHPDVLEGVLVDEPDLLIRPLRLYARAVPDHPQLATALEPILSRGLPRLCHLAIDQAATVTDREMVLGDTTVAAALASWVAVMDVDLIALTDAVDLLPPRLDLILNPLALDLHSQLAAQLRRVAAANPAAEPDLARSLNDLSIYLRAVGRRDEGLDAVEEAVAVRRRLAAADPAAFESDLAMSLNNLSVSLGDVGRRPEALAASEEAVALRRLQAQSNPANYESALAGSLNNLSGHLGGAGRHDEGLVVVQETVALYRRLGATDPAHYTPDLALSLENLSVHLGDASRNDEALAACEEAVNLRRQLSETNPAAYEPGLAQSLDTLSLCLGQVGRSDEGLAAIEDAVAVRRRLATANAAAYESELAGSLNNLSIGLAGSGRNDEGLAASLESIAIYRRLTTVNPAVHAGDLAIALITLSKRLGSAGRRSEALDAMKEAIDLRRQLADVDAIAHGPGLASSLGELSMALAGSGRSDEAVAAMQDAVEVVRHLAASDPADNEPALAGLLTTLSMHLGASGRTVECLAAIAEAVTIGRRLAAANPAAYEPGLVASLNLLSMHLGESGRRAEGVAAIKEAVAVCRRLAAAEPGAHDEALGGLLNNLSLHLRESDRRDEGLAAVEEAVAIYRGLAAANPAIYEPELAMSLSNLSMRLHEAGRSEAAERARLEGLQLQAAHRRGRDPTMRPALSSRPTTSPTSPTPRQS